MKDTTNFATIFSSRLLNGPILVFSWLAMFVAAGLTAVGVHVDSVGQADDVLLISNSIHHLRNLVKLTKNYCDSFHATLGANKTKLVAFGDILSLKIYYDKLACNISINKKLIQFSEEAEHVGVLTSVIGNLPALLV